MVVLAIVGTVLGIAYPVTRSFMAKSREAACLGNLRSLGVALQSYLQEHQDILPDLASGRATKTEDVAVIDEVLAPYVGGSSAFHCPADLVEFEKSGSSYLWNSTQSGLHVSKLSFFGIRNRPDKIPLITDKESWHPSEVNFLYADMSSSTKTRFAVGNSN
jgi:type II secretory pathway pseudopilin PulG